MILMSANNIPAGETVSFVGTEIVNPDQLFTLQDVVVDKEGISRTAPYGFKFIVNQLDETVTAITEHRLMGWHVKSDILMEHIDKCAQSDEE